MFKKKTRLPVLVEISASSPTYFISITRLSLSQSFSHNEVDLCVLGIMRHWYVRSKHHRGSDDDTGFHLNEHHHHDNLHHVVAEWIHDNGVMCMFFIRRRKLYQRRRLWMHVLHRVVLQQWVYMRQQAILWCVGQCGQSPRRCPYCCDCDRHRVRFRNYRLYHLLCIPVRATTPKTTAICRNGKSTRVEQLAIAFIFVFCSFWSRRFILNRSPKQ